MFIIVFPNIEERGDRFFLEELLSVIIGLTPDNIFLETLEKLLGIILVPWWDNLIILRSRCHVHTFRRDGGNKSEQQFVEQQKLVK